MSSSAYLYRVGRIKSELPEPINLDESPYAYVREEFVKDWERDIGQKRKVFFRTTDMFGVCEKIFGVRSRSARYDYSGGVIFMDESDNEVGRLTRDVLDSYATIKEFTAYLYEREDISSIDSIYFLDIHSGILSEARILDLLKQCVEQEPEYGSVCSDAVFALLKAYFVVLDGGTVYCDID